VKSAQKSSVCEGPFPPNSRLPPGYIAAMWDKQQDDDVESASIHKK